MLLDTCALLWLVQGGGRLSRAALDQVNSAPVLFVSAITGFEIGLKYHQGKLKLPASPTEWFKLVLEHHTIEIIPVSLHIGIRATELPQHHNDPVDRLIIATALINELPVVTHDMYFDRYSLSVIS